MAADEGDDEDDEQDANGAHADEAEEVTRRRLGTYARAAGNYVVSVSFTKYQPRRGEIIIEHQRLKN